MTTPNLIHLECTIVKTYHRFEVPGKGKWSKPNIFRAKSEMGNHSVSKEEDSKYKHGKPILVPKVRSIFCKNGQRGKTHSR